jgi:hypothetical protein
VVFHLRSSRAVVRLVSLVSNNQSVFAAKWSFLAT